MKKQKGSPRKAAPSTARTTTTKVAKKKAKAAAVAVKAKEAVEEQKEEEESGPVAAEEVVEEWGCLWSDVAVDEEMWWATRWIPFWEMEATGDAYDALYGDVLWDYDIWDLKANINP